MLRFSLFGFPVTVHWMFWVMVAILGGAADASSPQAFQALLLWVLAAFVSILIHELGHTFMQRRFGARAQIVLYAFGGLAIPDRSFTRGQDIVVSLAGPLVQIAVGAAFWGALNTWVGAQLSFRDIGFIAYAMKAGVPVTAVFCASMVLVSVFWGVLNLAPIFPLDGGHVLLSTLGPRNEKFSYLIGVACAIALALWMLSPPHPSIWNAVFFGALAYQNFQRSQGAAPPPFMRP